MSTLLERSIKIRMKEHHDAWEGPLGRARCEKFWRTHGRYCDRCGWHDGSWGRRELHVHHVNYLWPVGDEPDAVLRALCSRCHLPPWHKSIHAMHRKRYVNCGRDQWPEYPHLERVTDWAIFFGWWRRLLRTRPA